MTIDRAAEILGISRNSAYAAAANGELPVIRFGRRLLVPTARVLDILGQSGDLVPSTPHADRKAASA